MKANVFDGNTLRPYSDQDSDVLSDSTPYVWIDARVTQHQDPEVLAMLKQMGFTDVVAAYATRTYSSGMFQAFGDNMLGSTYAAADSSDQDPPVLIHCVWSKGVFITVRNGGDKALAQALEDIRPRAQTLFANPGPVPGVLMQLILDSIDRQLTDLQTRIAMLDGEIIITSKPDQLSTLQALRSPVEALGTSIPTYAENISESLVDPASLPGMDGSGVQALQTYEACVNDVVSRIDSVASDIRSAIQDYQGQVSTAQGNRINQLTLVSTIFLPITFMTGYFGMNFQYLSNSTMSFVSWLLFGVVLPVLMVIGSAFLLRKNGFQIGRARGHFHIRHGKPTLNGQAPSS